MSDTRKIIECFFPIGGLFIGFILGWVLYTYLQPSDEIGLLALRLLNLTFGILGWSFGIVLQSRKLYCCGQDPLDRNSKRKYSFLGLFCIAIIIIGSVALALKDYPLYFGMILILGALIGGEIGWGNPLKCFLIFSRKK